MDQDAYEKHNKPEAGGKPGIYKHPSNKEELHATSFPAADAFIRQGWVYDRPLESTVVRREATKSDAPTVEELKALRAENAQLKADAQARVEAEANAVAEAKVVEEAEKEEQPKALADLKVIELVELAEAEGIELPEGTGKPGTKKADVIAVIEAARAEKGTEE